ncbi:hypothetical protein [Sinorhizobium meliloti]|uniref:hypothetical protein n=1 Tax=Rhizobium meliloti TaxID=382 RepID=UPI000D1FA316|nr:hypothetical protein [Sinorhizobium meliloti]RMI05378.1 hypothetical protein DA101_022880 [Sinorhizobium meliloti]RVG86929.1 hypothetical protein CN218_29450 [Sinorhizobium meliloti]RVK90631.1 hypothetical protein CN150_27310 [Sinorhizobium meliloti]
MKAEALAAALREFVPSIFRCRREDVVVVGEGEWSELPTEIPNLGPIREEASRIVKELDEVLKHSNWRPDRGPPPSPDTGHWTLGSVEQRAPARKIHLGYLEPVRLFPVVERVPDPVRAFLTQIPGWDDYLKRENHPGVGWHYHYLADLRKRSDVLLAWDTRWQAPPAPLKNRLPPLHPLFGEKHGEGKADVRAKPWLWGDKKKESMYGVCAPDLRKWKIHEFRCASSQADPVWPSGAKVTPIPAPVSPPARKPREKDRRR